MTITTIAATIKAKAIVEAPGTALGNLQNRTSFYLNNYLMREIL